jgi:hypothetical protein
VPLLAQDEPRVDVTIEAPERIVAGDRLEILVSVRVHPTGAHPVLVTPTTEGRAVTAVRGRLLRADAEDPDAEVLRFRVPIMARSAGTAILRVHARAYACEQRCRGIEGEARAVLRVRRAAPE